MAKQKEDKFTVDAFTKQRRGRPPVANPKSGAQRAKECRARKKAGYSDPLKQAKSQLTDLRAISTRLMEMSAQWGDVDECFRHELERLADHVADTEGQLSEFIAGGGSFH